MSQKLAKVELAKKIDSKKFVNCCLHTPCKIVHRITGVPATEHIIKQLDENTKTSHGYCLPCTIRREGVEFALELYSKDEIRLALKFVASSMTYPNEFRRDEK